MTHSTKQLLEKLRKDIPTLPDDAEIIKRARAGHLSVEEYLLQEHLATEKQIVEALGVPTVGYEAIIRGNLVSDIQNFPSHLKKLIHDGIMPDLGLMDDMGVIPYEYHEDADDGKRHRDIHIAIKYPTKNENFSKYWELLSKSIQEAVQIEITPHLTTHTDFDRAVEKLRGIELRSKEMIGEGVEDDDMISVLDAAEDEFGGDNLAVAKHNAVSKKSGVEELFRTIVDRGIKNGASDIGIGLDQEKFYVTYRINGKTYVDDHPKLVQKIPQANDAASAQVGEKIAMLMVRMVRIVSDQAGITNHDDRDGTIVGQKHGYEKNIRVSLFGPTYPNESRDVAYIALRIHKEDKVSTLDQLGYREHGVDDIRRMVNYHTRGKIKSKTAAAGLIIVTGPTGSGKSTTINAVIRDIQEVNRESFLKINIIADPIEVGIPGTVQVSVKGGDDAEKGNSRKMTWAQAFNQTLRNDPDIIVFGEIREDVALDALLDAAATGHCVITTYHAGDIVDTITRLKDRFKRNSISIDKLWVALNGIINQDLVQCLCPECKVADSNERVSRLLKERGINDNLKGLNIFKKGPGCDHCRVKVDNSATGYKGIIAVSERLVVTPEVRKKLVKEFQSYENNDYYEFLKEIGCKTKFDDAVEKLKNGLVDIESILHLN